MSDRIFELGLALARAPDKRGILKTTPAIMIQAIDELVRRLLFTRAQIAREIEIAGATGRKRPAQRNDEVVGHVVYAEKAVSLLPAASSQNEPEAGQTTASNADQMELPASGSPNREGEGHQRIARQGQLSVAIPSRPLSPAQRSANIRVAAAVSMTVLDTFKVRDGRAIGDVRWSEISSLITKDEHSASVLRAVHREGVPADPNARIREVISAGSLDRIMRETNARAA